MMKKLKKDIKFIYQVEYYTGIKLTKTQKVKLYFIWKWDKSRQNLSKWLSRRI